MRYLKTLSIAALFLSLLLVYPLLNDSVTVDSPLEPSQNLTSENVTIVVLGDSFTYATYLPKRRQNRWTTVLEDNLTGSGFQAEVIPLTERGIGVERYSELYLNQTIAQEQTGRNPGHTHQPDILIIQTNNMDFRDNEEYRERVKDALEEENMSMDSQGAGRVWASQEREYLESTTLETRRNRTEWYLDRIADNVSSQVEVYVLYENVTGRYGNHVRPVARKHGWNYIDLDSFWDDVDREVYLENTYDGIGRKHPLYNSAGHLIWAENVFPHLTNKSRYLE